MVSAILPEPPAEIKAAKWWNVLDNTVVKVVLPVPFSCPTCHRMKCFFTVRRVPDGWTVTCIYCEEPP